MICRILRYSSILKAPLYLSSKYEKRPPQYQQFRLRANAAENFQQLNHLFNDSIKKQKYSSQAFALVCRNYSRIFRRAINTQNFNLIIIFGPNYETLSLINLKELTIIQLIDIVAFLNNGSMKTVLNIADPKFNAFVNELLDLVSNKWNTGQTNRSFSYLAKSAKCAELFHSPLYTYFIKQLSNFKQEMTIFDSITLLNFLLKGKSRSQTAECEIEYIKFIMKKFRKQQWLQKCSAHNIVDAINPLFDFSKLCPFIEEISTELRLIIQDLITMLKNQYKQFSQEQIIRFEKLLIKNKNQQEIHAKMIKLFFNGIKDEGSSYIDPTTIIRFLCYTKNPLLSQLYPQWEQKLLKMFHFYFVQNKISAQCFFDGLVQLVSTGLFQLHNALKLIQVLRKQADAMPASIRPSFVIQKSIQLYEVSLKLEEYEEASQLMYKLNQIHKNKIKQNLYYFHMFLQTNILFLKKLNMKVQIEKEKVLQAAKSKPFFKKATNLNEALFEQFDKLSKIKQFRYNCTLMTKYNLIYLEKSISALKYHLLYNQVIFILENVQINPSQIQIIFTSFGPLSVPEKFHPRLIGYLQKISSSKESSAYIYYQLVRRIKNIDMRCSTNQATLFMTIIKHSSYQTKLLYYSDNIMLHFLMTFAQKEYVAEVNELIEKGNFKTNQYQYLLLRILSYLVHRSPNFNAIQSIKQKIETINFTNETIFQYFGNTLKKFNLIQEKGVQALAKRNNMKYIPPQISNAQSKYMSLMNLLYRDSEFEKINNQKLEQFGTILEEQRNRKQIRPENLLRELIRVTRLHKAKIANRSQKIFSELLNKIALEVKTDRYWIIESLFLARQMKWILPQLFQKASQVARVESEWKNDIIAEQLLTVLLQYPIENKYNPEFINISLKILTYCPQKTSLLSQNISKLSSREKYMQKTLLYLNYLLSRLDNKQNVQKQL